jgi:hypothetical protein
MSEVNRRALLAGVGGVAAAGALATAAQALPNLPTPFSPEFIEYRRCLQLHIDACDVPEPDFGTPELEVWDAATTAACEARHQASRVIRDRPVCSRQDFAELALVVQQELWQLEPDGLWQAHSRNDELEDALMRAVFAVAEGAVNV